MSQVLHEIQEAWPVLLAEERMENFRALSRPRRRGLFLGLVRAQAELILALPPAERRFWVRLLPPDDAADLLQEVPAEEREELLSLLDEPSRREVSALLAYAEDDAGGLMSPRFARVRPEMSVEEAFAYLRRQACEKSRRCTTRTCSTASSASSASSRIATCFAAKPGERVVASDERGLVTVPEAWTRRAEPPIAKHA